LRGVIKDSFEKKIKSVVSFLLTKNVTSGIPFNVEILE
jgi:hypothetical protein